MHSIRIINWIHALLLHGQKKPYVCIHFKSVCLSVGYFILIKVSRWCVWRKTSCANANAIQTLEILLTSQHRKEKVATVTAVVVNGAIETCLQRLQWRPGQSSWRAFRLSHSACYNDMIIHINSLWPSDAIWRQGSWSTLLHVRVCCLTAPSHYLNKCWLIITKIQWCHS